MTTPEVLDALRRLHGATISYGNGVYSPGPWTTVCEWHNIDLLAFSAWRNPKGTTGGIPYPIVGYEVKVSRGDYRRELRSPYKRAGAVSFCTSFYFAVPDGLLKPEEIAWKPEPWTLAGDAWTRKPCPNSFEGGNRKQGYPTSCRKGRIDVIAHGPVRQFQSYRDTVTERCDVCVGKGYLERSRVELEAPTLWVPDDVGLVVVSDGGKAKVVKRAPTHPGAPARSHPLGMIVEDRTGTRAALGELARWLSVRPDPRHAVLNGETP